MLGPQHHQAAGGGRGLGSSSGGIDLPNSHQHQQQLLPQQQQQQQQRLSQGLILDSRMTPSGQLSAAAAALNLASGGLGSSPSSLAASGEGVIKASPSTSSALNLAPSGGPGPSAPSTGSGLVTAATLPNPQWGQQQPGEIWRRTSWDKCVTEV